MGNHFVLQIPFLIRHSLQMHSTTRPAEVSPPWRLQCYSLLYGRCFCTTFIPKGLELTFGTETCLIFFVCLFQILIKFNHWGSPDFCLKQQKGSHPAQWAGSLMLLGGLSMHLNQFYLGSAGCASTELSEEQQLTSFPGCEVLCVVAALVLTLSWSRSCDPSLSTAAWVFFFLAFTSLGNTEFMRFGTELFPATVTGNTYLCLCGSLSAMPGLCVLSFRSSQFTTYLSVRSGP